MKVIIKFHQDISKYAVCSLITYFTWTERGPRKMDPENDSVYLSSYRI